MQVTFHVEIPGDRAAVLKRRDEIIKALSPDTIVGAYIDHEYDPDDPDEEELHDVYMCDISEFRAKQAAEIAVYLAETEPAADELERKLGIIRPGHGE